MEPPTVTDRTREHPIPDRVRGLRWEIDSRHSLMCNSYGSIDLCDNQRHGIAGRITIADARRYGAALLAVVAAREGEAPAVEVRVVNWGLENAVKFAEQAATRAEGAAKELREALEQVAANIARAQAREVP